MISPRIILRFIRNKIAEIFADVHTHAVVVIDSYDAVENTCSVRPCVKRIRTTDPDNETTIKFGKLEDVPVNHRGSGKLLLGCAPQAGSYGILHVAERSTDVWLTKGGVEDPDSVRKFDINDGFLEYGAYPLVVDGDNGKLVVPIATDRISLRTRSGDTEVSVLDDESIQISNENVTVTIAADETVTVENSSGSFSLSPAGQFDANGKFTVDP